MALLIALVLGGCMQATLNPVSDANFTARDKNRLLVGLPTQAQEKAGAVKPIIS
jgi:hypothetical protein